MKLYGLIMLSLGILLLVSCSLAHIQWDMPKCMVIGGMFTMCLLAAFVGFYIEHLSEPEPAEDPREWYMED